MKQKTICFYFWGSLETESNFIEVVLINVKELWEILEESYWCYLITKSCPALCKPTDYSTPGFPALHYLPEFAQIHVHWVVMPSNHLILCCPLLLHSIFPSIRVFSNESNLIRSPSWHIGFTLVRILHHICRMFFDSSFPVWNVNGSDPFAFFFKWPVNSILSLVVKLFTASSFEIKQKLSSALVWEQIT